MTDLKKPEITLKSLSMNITLSEETPAYTANVYVDGKYAISVKNSGHGGPDEVFFKNPKTPPQSPWNKLKELNALIGKTHPKIATKEEDGYDCDTCLEILCHQIAWRSPEINRIKRMLKTHILFREEGDPAVKQIKYKPTPDMLIAYKDKNPTYEILNTLGADKIYDLLQSDR